MSGGLAALRAGAPATGDLFLGRLPAKPYCSKASGELRYGLDIRPATLARRRPHIQVNLPWARAFIVNDVDRPRAAAAWMEADLPMPYWVAKNPDNGHAHQCDAIDAPVLLGDHDRQAPMRYLEAVERAIAAALEADPAYGGLVTKNPLHPAWQTLTGGWPRTLAEYAEHLPDLGKHRRKGPAKPIGVGRNVDTFDGCRLLAYREVREWWPRGYVRWQAHCVERANGWTADHHQTPLDVREAYHIGRSIALWVWRRFSPEGYAKWQASVGRKGGAASGEARRKAIAKRDAVVLALREQGLSLRAIAAMRGIGLGKDGVAKAVARARCLPNPYQDRSPQAQTENTPDPALAAGMAPHRASGDGPTAADIALAFVAKHRT